MKFLHFEAVAGIKNIIQVQISNPANVKFMDGFNYNKYKLNKTCTFMGGFYKNSPVEFSPNEERTWHIIVDLDNSPGEVVASVNILRR